MPFLGLGLHVIVALLFAVHAVRTGKELYWLFILFIFPLLGSIVYFVVVYLPDSKLNNGAKKAVALVAKSIDPSREVREARAAFEFTPTVQNQLYLAATLLEAGSAAEAATMYESCLQGNYADDSEIQFSAAHAFVESGRYQDAISYLQKIHAADVHFRAEQISLLMARALAGAGHNQQAKSAFEDAFNRFGSFAVLVDYAIWAINVNDLDTAQRLQVEIDQTMQRWNRSTRELNKSLVQHLNAAKKAAHTHF